MKNEKNQENNQSENFEDLYFKIFEFKEDFTNQMNSYGELIEDYLNCGNYINNFSNIFSHIEKNRDLIKESNLFCFK